jgi:hypothetical protein
MISEVETISEMDALVSVCLVVGCQCRQNAKFDARGIAVFLDGPYDFDCTPGSLLLIVGLDDLSKRSLTK